MKPPSLVSNPQPLTYERGALGIEYFFGKYLAISYVNIRFDLRTLALYVGGFQARSKSYRPSYQNLVFL